VKAALTYERASAVLAYNPATGALTWKARPSKCVRVGDIAGTKRPDGRLQVRLGAVYKAHRIAWLLHYGSMPVNFIDHINGDPADNRIANLRDVTASLNQHNRHAAGRNNALGVLNVRRGSAGKFRAMASIDGKYRHIGTFDTAEEAHAAAMAEKIRQRPECAHLLDSSTRSGLKRAAEQRQTPQAA
jgi:hypothetical protein